MFIKRLLNIQCGCSLNVENVRSLSVY